DHKIGASADTAQEPPAVANRQIIQERADEPMASSKHRVSVVRGNVKVVQDVTTVVAAPGSALAVWTQRIRGRAKRVGPVVSKGVGVLKREAASQTSGYFYGKRIIGRARSIVSREHFGKIRELKILLPQCRRRG